MSKGTTKRRAHWSDLALTETIPAVYWLQDPAAPESSPTLHETVDTDLAVVGGGFAGLWTALLAKERDPGRDVIVVDAGQCGHAASGRNGGFCSATLTHGFGNGQSRWPSEMPILQKMGTQNLDDIEQAVKHYGIDCHFERTGEITVATEQYQCQEFTDLAGQMRSLGADVEVFDAQQVRKLVNSPTYVGGFWDKSGCALVEPARLAWGLRDACLNLGVRIYEETTATNLEQVGSQVHVQTPEGVVRARRVVLASNAYPSLIRRTRLMTVPVYDYVLMTEPLTDSQLASIGWNGRQGLGDSANQFHYYRLTHDNRILWGGYDAIYYYSSRLDPKLEQRQATFRKLSRHFFKTFPQLEGLRFTHQWGGAIDTCTRFCAFYGTAMRGCVGYTAGFTGLGVAATRFAANVMLDLIDAHDTPRTRLTMVRKGPLPFPPEPLRYAAISLTRWSLDRADHNQGKRNGWLRALDKLGLGFDS